MASPRAPLLLNRTDKHLFGLIGSLFRSVLTQKTTFCFGQRLLNSPVSSLLFELFRSVARVKMLASNCNKRRSIRDCLFDQLAFESKLILFDNNRITKSFRKVAYLAAF